MSEHLLPYYDKELSFIRESAQSFAKAHPQIAAGLGITERELTDPEINRLIQAFAYLNARIQYRLDGQLPEVSEALLDHLYPNYLSPSPAMGIVQIFPSSDLATSRLLKANSPLECILADGKDFQFLTRYATEVVPLAIESIRLEKFFNTPSAHPHSKAALRIRLTTLDEIIQVSDLGIKKLRLHINQSKPLASLLYDGLLSNTLQIDVRDANGSNSLVYSRNHIDPVGFDSEQTLLPYDKRLHDSYKIINDYTLFPEKFMFLDLVDIDYSTLHTNAIDIIFYLKDIAQSLQSRINDCSITLNCIPIVNLFEKRAEPIQLDHHRVYYPITMDSFDKDRYQIYQVNTVSEIQSDGSRKQYHPMYRLTALGEHKGELVWQTKRESSSTTSLMLSNTQTGRSLTQDSIIDLVATCMDASLPNDFKVNYADMHLQFVNDIAIPVDSVKLLAPLTDKQEPIAKHKNHWSLIAHVGQKITLLDEASDLKSLKSMLSLYNRAGSASNQHMSDALKLIAYKTTYKRIHEEILTSYCRGVDIQIVIDDKLLADQSVILFCQLVEQIFIRVVSVNSFIILSVFNTSKHLLYQGNYRSRLFALSNRE